MQRLAQHCVPNAQQVKRAMIRLSLRLLTVWAVSTHSKGQPPVLAALLDTSARVPMEPRTPGASLEHTPPVDKHNVLTARLVSHDLY